MTAVATKPLGGKAYGSIPHLPGSRLGPGDHKLHAGQESICLHLARDRHDHITVTEKLDGSNVAVAKIDGQVMALTRAGYLATTSRYEQHHLFAEWVRRHHGKFDALLIEGERVCAEWLAQAHGTRYELPHEPFVAFDMIGARGRNPWSETLHRCIEYDIETARVISSGPPIDIDTVLDKIKVSWHGAIDVVEGAVWRVERKGEFDFMAKFVRAEKVDGCYLPEASGQPPVWNWRP